MIQINEIQKLLKPLFKREKSVLFAYIFGSTVQDRTYSESDIDLAFYLDTDKVKDIFKKRILLIEEAQAFLNKTVEIVILNEINSIFFKFVIIKEGLVVYERAHSQRVDFELTTMREYYDYQPFLEQYNKAYLRRPNQ
ncbi:MAG: nucleotidyltransferase domain-containing protein [Candidatus Aminicenantes bacterium]|nr:nucleotidyltransferase domain-containing protein [Candidatus Aminicenantes bacterium]